MRKSGAQLLRDAGYEGFLSVEIAEEDKAVAASTKELRRIANNVR